MAVVMEEGCTVSLCNAGDEEVDGCRSAMPAPFRERSLRSCGESLGPGVERERR